MQITFGSLQFIKSIKGWFPEEHHINSTYMTQLASEYMMRSAVRATRNSTPTSD